MKIEEKQLREIIREEIQKLNESGKADTLLKLLNNLTTDGKGFKKDKFKDGREKIIGGELSLDKNENPLFNYHNDKIDPKVEKILKKYNWDYEWEDSGTIVFYKEF